MRWQVTCAPHTDAQITFRRTQEFSNFSSGLAQAIVFEVEDRESIGGSAYGGQRAVCCTADLAKLGVCSEGEIIPGWPQVFGVADELVATLPSKSIQISRTGMYNFTGSCPLLLLYSDYSGSLSMFEMAFWYFDYAEFNETGIRPTGILGCSHRYLDIEVTFCHCKNACLKCLVLEIFLCVHVTMCEARSERILCGFLFCVESGTALVSSRGESNLND
ncbi:hypothetical protein Peur_020806 [Populus x canadensis]